VPHSPPGGDAEQSVMNSNCLFQVKIIGHDPDSFGASWNFSMRFAGCLVSFWIIPFGHVMRTASTCWKLRKPKLSGSPV
jgi:hypothetical protein